MVSSIFFQLLVKIQIKKHEFNFNFKVPDKDLSRIRMTNLCSLLEMENQLFNREIRKDYLNLMRFAIQHILFGNMNNRKCDGQPIVSEQYIPLRTLYGVAMHRNFLLTS